ncbi:hypothetical protein P154DRAFT_456285 [Amniculicola lignicola CBS 123094]|uniref:dihydroneopterin aldolase n=1 Tax=Amniculicola lignicola CBS 123094 TaxID=1392246 RepID=A0A6A5X027_9PLEO|nr:hypothetical protein P154DRAFT_456285 [Amniculicola lignicola CBS 123094]
MSNMRHDLWLAQLATNDVTDRITVRNLEATVHAGVDVWGRKKPQRVLLSTTLHLAQSSNSAAEADALDNSTVHYGLLSKDLKKCMEKDEANWMTTEQLASSLHDCIRQTAAKTAIHASELNVFYPKGSMAGDGAGLLWAFTSRVGPFSRVLYLRNLRILCVIGINANERLKKQPVVVNVWIEGLSDDRTDDYIHLEAILVEAISESSFETLESLATMAVQRLRQDFFRPGGDDESFIRLRVEKPMAVPFADAPAIEILRAVRA